VSLAAPKGERGVMSTDMGCGGCVAVCPNNVIGGGSFADQSIREQLDQALREWA